MAILTLETIVDKLPTSWKISHLPKEVLMNLYERKLNGETNERIATWLRDDHGFDISPMQLWRIFKATVPDFLMNSKKTIVHDDVKVVEQIRELEKVADMQLDRIKSQRWDEMDQEGIGRMNPQTGEIEYAATNKNLNDTIRTYNGLIKNILEMKASIGLIRKQPETIEVKTSMNAPTRQVLRDMIQNALKTGPDLTKFISEGNSEPATIEAEFTERGEQNVEQLLESPKKTDVKN